MADGPSFIERTKEISLFKNLITNTADHGILSFVIAPAGFGKTNFLEQISRTL